ncbi:hypothetical protein NL676_024522 [Syzygium grande]|nr:hypothetical protein NL676_024522 [Syzygium grande]
MSPNLELQEGNYLDNNEEPSSLVSFPPPTMGLGVEHGAPHLTHQQEENQVICNQTNPYEASSGSHQFINESPLIPIDLDAQYSSSVTPQQAMPFWARGVSQQQINDQVLMDAPNASIDAAVEISILLPEPSVPYCSRRIINSVYDPMYETLGLPIDPHLRMFLASQGGNPSSFKHNAIWQSNSEPQPWRLPDK